MRRPKKVPAKYLEDAPPYVLGVYYHPDFIDCYTVLFGWPVWEERMGGKLPYLALGKTTQAYSQYGEGYRQGMGQLIAWNDMPVGHQRHVIVRMQGQPGEGPHMGYMMKDPHHGWLIIEYDGLGGMGPDFKNKSHALKWAKENGVMILPGPRPDLVITPRESKV